MTWQEQNHGDYLNVTLITNESEDSSSSVVVVKYIIDAVTSILFCLGLGDISLLHRYPDMRRLDIVLEFRYRNIVIW